MNFVKNITASVSRPRRNNNNNNNNMNELINLDTSNIKQFTLEGFETMAKVSDVYDGDTCKVVFKYKDEYIKWNCRIMGVDTPELRTRNLKEKECGYFVRDKVREKMLNKIVKVNCKEFDKYGRLLVDITINDCNLTEWLITNKYAYAYGGGKKEIIEWDVSTLN